MAWPPDYSEEYGRRYHLLSVLQSDPNEWQYLKKHYSTNPIDWINDWCVTYDPRNKDPKPKLLPFTMFPRQEEMVQLLCECVRDNESALIEKCRDMGASWVAVCFSVWLWLFHPGSAIGFGSRKAEYVDKLGDPKTIFVKIRMIIQNLPDFMLPEGYSEKEHSTYMRLLNPENGATITGEAGDNIGRGGRTTIYFKDESAHYERPDLIEAALGDNTDVQIDISSVNGPNNVFYRRRMAGTVWEPGKEIEKGFTRVFIMDWRHHPLKTQEWYDRRRAKAEREGLLHNHAQEIDRDYVASLDRIIIRPEWVKAAIDAHIKLGIKDDGEKYAHIDVADEGGDKNAFSARYGVILKHLDQWGEGDTGETANRAYTEAKRLGCSGMSYDSIGVGAGVKAETNRLRREKVIPQSFGITPWNAGDSVLDPDKNMIKGDLESPKNEDYFLNLKAQAWWRLAQRFYKTYMAITKGAVYDHDELISIPSDIPFLHELETELCQVVQTHNGKGKMLIDKKPNGGRSPNLADSVVSCYCPIRKGVDYSKLLEM